MRRSEVEARAREVLGVHADYFDTYIHACCYAREISLWDWTKPDYSDPQKVVDWFHFFWSALPNNESIRTAAFFKVCDIAECVFGFDDEEDGLVLPS